jgi:hypothetical protein
MRAAQSCPLFNVNLASWNVARVLDASTMFNYASGNRPPNNPFRSSFSQLIAEALVLFARATIRRRADQCDYRDGRAWILNALEAYISSNALRFSIRVGRSACPKGIGLRSVQPEHRGVERRLCGAPVGLEPALPYP